MVLDSGRRGGTQRRVAHRAQGISIIGRYREAEF
jgi:hypothetical protein